ncbi:PRC-barrel domain-containing protein [Bradyrhizobium sp. 6(2017)]|uniref:PRC-barrel domain-containing protein n=1 Tax=Bradyrhizobium sp. 6(2017) TaxID=1197460 RepID=UPI0013E1D09A|nr:PRC-barrel domain-containing protein [Bradyrhizobium sp. 6(2017)]QIG97343.1 PRC-barrel domain containing protein [Bradyrhizobium sp. 6(2017)]
MKSFLAVALIGAAVIGGSAFAQSTQAADRVAPAATSRPTDAKMALNGSWRASKLMGLNVYNEANEKLGDINELLVDKSGKIEAVVIGIGGFLGMGEHDIAVSMDKLKFVEEPVRTSSTSSSTTARDTTTGTASTNTSNRNAYDWAPDHAVMSGNKEQLKALPQFKYSDYN